MAPALYLAAAVLLAELAPSAAAPRIRALIADGQWQQALEQAQAVQRAAPQEPLARSLLAEALFRAGRLDEVEAALDGLAEADAPARALMTLGRLRDAQGRGADAVRLMRLAAERGADDPEVLFQAAGAVATRAEAIGLLERYLAAATDVREERLVEARGQLRLYEALGERGVWTNVARPEQLELALGALWVPGTGQVVGYTVEARLTEQGKPVRMLLDSGSTSLFVLERIARKHDFAPLTDLTIFGGGGKGRHATSRGFFPALDLGGLVFGDVLASTAKVEIDPQGRYHGLVGLSAFNGYRVTLDLAKRRLALVLDAEPITDGVPYYMIYGQMLVEVQSHDGERGLFLFDTGATHTSVALSLVERIEGARAAESIDLPAYGGLRRGARALRGVEIVFAGTRASPPNLSAVDLSVPSQVGGVEVSGYLGLDVLGGKLIEVDTVRQTLRVR